jgi:hypothetical protein
MPTYTREDYIGGAGAFIGAGLEQLGSALQTRNQRIYESNVRKEAAFQQAELEEARMEHASQLARLARQHESGLARQEARNAELMANLEASLQIENLKTIEDYKTEQESERNIERANLWVKNFAEVDAEGNVNMEQLTPYQREAYHRLLIGEDLPEDRVVGINASPEEIRELNRQYAGRGIIFTQDATRQYIPPDLQAKLSIYEMLVKELENIGEPEERKAKMKQLEALRKEIMAHPEINVVLKESMEGEDKIKGDPSKAWLRTDEEGILRLGGINLMPNPFWQGEEPQVLPAREDQTIGGAPYGAPPEQQQQQPQQMSSLEQNPPGMPTYDIPPWMSRDQYIATMAREQALQTGFGTTQPPKKQLPGVTRKP